MIKADLHTHTSFSTDSKAPMEDMVRAAVDLGLDAYCITDHYDYGHHIFDHRDQPGFEYAGKTEEEIKGLFNCDADSSYREFVRLKEKYGDRIFLRYGMELGLQPCLCDHFREYVKKYPFDLLIGSCHEAGGKDPYYPRFIEGRSAMEAYSFYFEEMLRCVEVSHNEMDVLAHPDYGIRYHRPEGFEFHYEDYGEVLDEILRLLKDKGIALECNTGSFKYFDRDKLPIRAILKRYRQLGGELVTVGSDAHAPERIAGDFDRAEELLKECGFDGYYVFEKRVPHRRDF